jgi:hypothetical protein
MNPPSVLLLVAVILAHQMGNQLRVLLHGRRRLCHKMRLAQISNTIFLYKIEHHWINPRYGRLGRHEVTLVCIGKGQ